MGIVTDSTPVDAAEGPGHVQRRSRCTSCSPPPDEQAKLADLYRNPMQDADSRGGRPFGYGDAKKMLLAKIDAHFGPARERRKQLAARPGVRRGGAAATAPARRGPRPTDDDGLVRQAVGMAPRPVGDDKRQRTRSQPGAQATGVASARRLALRAETRVTPPPQTRAAAFSFPAGPAHALAHSGPIRPLGRSRSDHGHQTLTYLRRNRLLVAAEVATVPQVPALRQPFRAAARSIPAVRCPRCARSADTGRTRVPPAAPSPTVAPGRRRADRRPPRPQSAPRPPRVGQPRDRRRPRSAATARTAPRSTGRPPGPARRGRRRPGRTAGRTSAGTRSSANSAAAAWGPCTSPGSSRSTGRSR